MSSRLFFVTAFAWLLSTWLQGLLADEVAGTSDIATVLSMQVIEIRTYATIPVPIPRIDWVSAVGRLLVWDYPWFQGGMEVVRWLIVLPLTAAVLWGMITGVLPVLISAAGQIAGAASNLLGGVLRLIPGIGR